jgi:hypothetical protein
MALSAQSAPRTWSQLGLSRKEAVAGFVTDARRLLVRSYVSAESGQAYIEGEADDEFYVDVAVLREWEQDPVRVAVGDLVMFLGEVAGYHTTLLWAPMLVVRLGDYDRGRRRAWSLVDTGIADASVGTGDDCIPVTALTHPVRQVVRQLATSGEAADLRQRRALLSAFGL